MSFHDEIVKIADQAMEANGISKNDPVKAELVRSAIAEAIYAVITSSSFIDHIDRELGQRMS